MEDKPFRHWSARRFPYENSTQFPNTRFSNLHESTLPAFTFVSTHAHAAKRQRIDTNTSFFEFSFRTQPKPFLPLIPRRLSNLKGCSIWRIAKRKLIAYEICVVARTHVSTFTPITSLRFQGST